MNAPDSSIPQSFSISSFKSKTDNVPVPHEVSWPALVQVLTTHQEREEKDGRLWSPASYPPGKTRANENVNSLCAAVFDFDTEDLPWERLKPKVTVNGYAYTVHSTFSHTEEHPRYRLVIPLAAPVPAKEWPEVWERLNGFFGGKNDAATRAASNMFYLPAHKPDAPYFTEQEDGTPLDPATLPDPVTEATERKERQIPPPHLFTLEDEELLRLAEEARNGDSFSRLWRGDTSDYDGDDSRADLAFCCDLAFWTRKDAAQMDRLFRRSGLFRPKWDEKHYGNGRTYGEGTIDKAISMTTETYSPTGSPFFGGGFGWSGPSPSANGHAADGDTSAGKTSGSITSNAFSEIGQTHWMRRRITDWRGRSCEGSSRTPKPIPPPSCFSSSLPLATIVGRGPYFVTEADHQSPGLFVVMIGTSAKGRKGSSWSHIRELFRLVDPEWVEKRLQSGLSSGEGMIWAVRDPIEKSVPVREKGKITGYQMEVVDPGVEDKRLLVIESEFASTLKVLGREGSTLSPLIRDAWDRGKLQSITKNSPASATGAHISIIGHVTKQELCRHLNETEAGNGFANRFLWLCVRRSKCLPEGGSARVADALAGPLIKAVAFAREVQEMKRDEEARAIWHAVYPELSEGKPGLLGAVIARGETQVVRLSCIYALLDQSNLVRKEHLLAALACWEYAEASARFIFGHALGDRVADELLRALRAAPQGLTRTELSSLFNRNLKAGEITRGLGVLVEHRVVEWKEEQTEGRPVERWFAVHRA